MSQTQYGDITPRTAGFVAKEMLTRALPLLIIEQFAQVKPLPTNSTKTMIFRRYNALDPTPNALTEGVTPSAKKLTKTDVQVTLQQYGDRVEISDVVMDTHEDPVLREATEILGEQAAQMVELVRYSVLKASTSKGAADATAVGDAATGFAATFADANVKGVLSRELQRKVTRQLRRQNARPITSLLGATVKISTRPVAPAYIALAHTDLESDIRNMEGFVPVEEYASGSPIEGEIGKVENCRYILSTVFDSEKGAGPASTAVVNTAGNADIYPVIYLARDAFATVPLRGKNALTPMVVNPKPSDSDPLAQRGHVGWKTMTNAVILQDAWMFVAFVTCSA